MRILTKRSLDTYARQYPSAAASLRSWHRLVSHAVWSTPHAVKATLGTASIINQERIVFNIHGNHFRMIAAINYSRQHLFILWFGTHASYDTIDAATVIWKPMS